MVRKVGRPKVGSVAVLVKFPPDQLAKLDRWVEEQKRFSLRHHFRSRQEAVRWLTQAGIEEGLYPPRRRA